MDTSEKSDFERLLRGSEPAVDVHTSSLSDGFFVQRRAAPALERKEEVVNSHYILLWRDAMLADREYRRGRFTRVVKPKGTLSLGSAGVLPAVRPLSAYNVVACIIDAEAAGRIAAEVAKVKAPSFHQHLAVKDAAMAELVESAVLESESGYMSGRLYADSLAYVIISRFVRIASIVPAQTTRSGVMPIKRLKAVVDRMKEELDQDLSLTDLASESGFSRAHFLRMFKAATGSTPHRYLHELRLDMSREKLSSSKSSITEIALDCGFSSHSHFTRAFRERFGQTPNSYRRKE